MEVAKKSSVEAGGMIRMEIGAGASAGDLPAARMEVVYEMVGRLGSCNAVVVFSKSRCCMCTVAKRLLFSLGVGPAVVELDEHAAGCDIEAVLSQLMFGSGGEGGGGMHRQHSAAAAAVPAVFVGGKLLGGVETLMACHINGTLVPLLKDAGALWL
ncbi:hypothetical protein L484_005898 [Morus notabilis]|uniref:Glutaredoxin domain-containing protein n=1 Tax=Morus notabilis TaxID=981085 RepID=W9QLP8_9ROSA|nr:glutaredoxin-C5 [Morus notabilis]EXB25442.1 hypothetical protein L484_005898 [Morus notabilis]